MLGHPPQSGAPEDDHWLVLRSAIIDEDNATVNFRFWSWGMEIQWGNDWRVDQINLDEVPVGQSVTGNADLRGKTQMAKALSFLRRGNDDWFKATIGLLDIIDNGLRPRRNEVIHARRQMSEREIHRVTYRTKLLKPQSFQQILETEQRIPIKISQLMALGNEINRAWAGLLILMLTVIRPESVGGRPPLPAILFQQWFRQQGLGSLLSNENSAPKHPRGSSRGSSRESKRR
jgi:hypothetical protein